MEAIPLTRLPNISADTPQPLLIYSACSFVLLRSVGIVLHGVSCMDYQRLFLHGGERLH